MLRRVVLEALIVLIIINSLINFNSEN